MTRRIRRILRVWAGFLIALLTLSPSVGCADTVASLLGNFTINQFCGLKLAGDSLGVHYVVVFGQLPALRELHQADADHNGVTSQAERDAYVGALAPGLADGLRLRVDGVTVPLHATRWTSSLPTEQGGFSLRVDVDFEGPLPEARDVASRKLEFSNENYAGRIGWHEIVVVPAPGLSVYDTNAYNTSLTGGLAEALQALPAAGPLDERSVYLTFGVNAPLGSKQLGARSDGVNGSTLTGAKAATRVSTDSPSGNWIERRTRSLVNAISGPMIDPRVGILTLLGALLLGAVHALSPGHGKTIVGAYLIGSRGTPRHAVFLGVTVTITHTLGVFAIGFATLYASRFIVPERLFPILSLISALLVLGMGLTLLIQRARIARHAFEQAAFGSVTRFRAITPMISAPGLTRQLILAPGSRALDPTMHSHGGGPMHSHLPPEKITWRSLLTLGISGGLVPCPSAMVLLLAAVALDKTAYGMLLVLAFSVGLAITLTMVGLAFLYARNRFTPAEKGRRWTAWMPVLNAGTITMLGIALCVGALRTFG
jgi:ABC-type nickel/cobalt efflux system permease component RcnA